MDDRSATFLNELNARFYAENAQAFSDTRSQPWNGWMRSVDLVLDEWGISGTRRLIDVGCGNLRFEKYLASRYSGRIECVALDNCEALVDVRVLPAHVTCEFCQVDIVARLLEGKRKSDSFFLNEFVRSALSSTQVDLSVAFGVMHHVPGEDARMRLLEEMARSTKEGGFMLISFWQFMNDKRVAKKAEMLFDFVLEDMRKYESFPGNLDLDYNDWFLGWQQRVGSYRYCHAFTDGEVERLISSVSSLMTEVASFKCDGPTGDSNMYSVLRRKKNQT